MGIVEIITLLLALSGFGVTQNPKAPSADQVMVYAIPDADAVAFTDLVPIVPNNYKKLAALPNDPAIKGSKELEKIVRDVVTQVEGGRTMVKGMTGIDLASDITDATAFVQYVPGGKEPAFVVVVRGKLPPTVLDSIAGMAKQQVQTMPGGKLLETGKDSPALALTKDGVMLAGTTKLIKDRLSGTWKAPSHAPGTNLGYAAAAIDAHPIHSLTVTLSAAARKDIATKMPGTNFLTDVVKRHKAASWSLYADGIGWTWVDTTRAGLDQIAMMSDGFVEIMRAAQIAPRGVAKIMLGAIDSYKGKDKRVDEIIKRKGDIMKIVETYTGDGNFKVTANKDAAKLRLDYRATGKSLSEVLPAAMILPGLGSVLLFSGGKMSSSTPAPYEVVAPPQPVRAPQPKQPAPKQPAPSPKKP
jgi:hypothetical protein